MITAERFREATGYDPRQDDLDRCNCPLAGEIGHTFCGWDVSRDMPRFVAGSPRVSKLCDAWADQPWAIQDGRIITNGEAFLASGEEEYLASREEKQKPITNVMRAGAAAAFKGWRAQPVPGAIIMEGGSILYRAMAGVAPRNRQLERLFDDALAAQKADMFEVMKRLLAAKDARIAELDTELATLRSAFTAANVQPEPPPAHNPFRTFPSDPRRIGG